MVKIPFWVGGEKLHAMPTYEPTKQWSQSLKLFFFCFVFTALKMQIEVFWIVTPCSVVVGYQRLGGPYCHNLEGELDV
jgi:hypothetical protein